MAAALGALVEIQKPATGLLRLKLYAPLSDHLVLSLTPHRCPPGQEILKDTTTMSVTLHTNLGDLKIEVFCESVPKTAEVK